MPDDLTMHLAHHEGGHAVALHLMGFEVGFATIMNDDSSDGCVRDFRPVGWEREPISFLERFVTVVCGMVAGARYDEIARPEVFSMPNYQEWLKATASRDGELIQLILECFQDFGHDPDAATRKAQRDAENLVTANWDRIEAFANVLLAEKSLGPGRVKSVLKTLF